MKRLRVLALVAGTVLCVGVAPAALAAPPVHYPSPPLPPLEFAPGEMCEDGLVHDVVSSRSRSSEFTRADGTFRLLDRGSAHSRLTNTTTGESTDLSGGYEIRLDFLPDGTLEAHVSGVILAWYFEGDPTNLDPGVYVVWGHAHETYDPNGILVSAHITGRIVDACGLVGA